MRTIRGWPGIFWRQAQPRAGKVAGATMDEVREAMGMSLDYEAPEAHEQGEVNRVSMAEEAKIVVDEANDGSAGHLRLPVAANAVSAEARSQKATSLLRSAVSDVYEGPLDLLLDLIRKQDIDIYDIPIAKITAQYLAYVEKIARTGCERRRRIHLHGGGADPHQVEDAAAARSAARRRRRRKIRAAELVNRLIEHEKFKSAAQMLMQKQQIEDAVLVESGASKNSWTPKAPSRRSPPT